MTEVTEAVRSGDPERATSAELPESTFAFSRDHGDQGTSHQPALAVTGAPGAALTVKKSRARSVRVILSGG